MQSHRRSPNPYPRLICIPLATVLQDFPVNQVFFSTGTSKNNSRLKIAAVSVDFFPQPPKSAPLVKHLPKQHARGKPTPGHAATRKCTNWHPRRPACFCAGITARICLLKNRRNCWSEKCCCTCLFSLPDLKTAYEQGVTPTEVIEEVSKRLAAVADPRISTSHAD